MDQQLTCNVCGAPDFSNQSCPTCLVVRRCKVTLGGMQATLADLDRVLAVMQRVALLSQADETVLH